MANINMRTDGICCVVFAQMKGEGFDEADGRGSRGSFQSWEPW